MQFVVAFLLILFAWLLGFMLGVNCIRLGATYLRPQCDQSDVVGSSAVCLILTQVLGVTLVLLGLGLFYSMIAPFAEWPGYRWIGYFFSFKWVGHGPLN